MDILITLDSGLGANLGPDFNLVANNGGTITPDTATRTELLAGKLVSVSDTSTIVFVQSIGTCTTQLPIGITGITSTTTTSTTAAPTTTTSTTAAPTTTTTSTSTSTTSTTLAPIPVTLAYSNVDGPTACYKFTAPIPDTATYYLQPGGTLADGNTLYVDGVYSNIVADGFYSNGVDYWEVNVVVSGGVLSNGTPCPQTTTTTTSTTSTSTSTTSTSTTEAPTTTTTTAAETTTTTTAGTTTTLGYTTFSLTYSNSAGQTACTDYATPTNRNFYYAGPGATLTTGTILYTTSALTTPVANGYYSNGANYWNTAASAGNLQNETVCAGATSSTTTTTAAPTTTTTTAAPTTTTTTAAPTTTTTTAGAATVDISISNTSLDVPIGSMTINGVDVDWVGYGATFVLGSGDNGSFTSNQIGTYNVVIGYGGHIPGQKITFTDSASNITCQNLNGSIGTFIITGATITAGTTITVLAEDGAC